MNSKEYLSNEAERIYIYEFSMIDEIAAKLNINRKTVMRWKEKGDWENKKRAFLKSKQNFHEELYEFARKLMKDISVDLENGEKVDPGRMYAFCRMIPLFAKVKNYEDTAIQKNNENAPKGLTPELIQRIEEEVLGITHE